MVMLVALIKKISIFLGEIFAKKNEWENFIFITTLPRKNPCDHMVQKYRFMAVTDSLYHTAFK